MRWWLLTTTSYATWLPGDPRGSVTSVRDTRPGEAPSATRREHDQHGEDWENELPGLRHSAKTSLRGPKVALDQSAAEAVLEQFIETCGYRGWDLEAVSIMPTHFHAVVAAPHEVDPGKVLGDLKAYASRRLNRMFGPPPSGEWWTENGSKRPLYDDRAVEDATNYVLYKQPNPIIVWSRRLGRFESIPGEPGA